MTATGYGEQARLIALDLVALYRDGAIVAADDPAARFYAVMIHPFEARYAGRAVEQVPHEPFASWAKRKPLPFVK